MLFLNNSYNFTVAMFGRKQVGKMSFLLMLLDRNDITIMDIFQNEDYYKVTYSCPEMGVVNVYKYFGFENNLSYMEDILSELSSFISQLDYVFYFIRSIHDINEFDRRFIQRLKDKGTMVFCVFNKLSNEEISKTRLYIEQGNLNVNTFACNCMNRLDVMNINSSLEQYAKDETALHDLMQFLMESPKTVLFLDRVTVGASAKNIQSKYFQLFKAIADKNGTAIYMSKERLKSYIEHQTIRPDVLITGNKIILDVEDLTQYI